MVTRGAQYQKSNPGSELPCHGLGASCPSHVCGGILHHSRGWECSGNRVGLALDSSQVPGGSPVPWEVQNIFNGWDADKTGKMTIEEVLLMGGEDATPDTSARLRTYFKQADQDENGFLTIREFKFLLEIIAEFE